MPDTRAPTSSDTTFDEQAARYDARVGLPDDARATIAQAIVTQSGVHSSDLVVELGAGTGEIGSSLTELPIRYVGLDASAAMLRQFRAKAVDRAPSLVLADCDRAWPFYDGVAAVVFASRVIHLLDPEHAARETLRVGRPAGLLIVGRVLRAHDSIKERLRRRRQELLMDAGAVPRQGEAGTRRVIALCQEAGSESLGRQVVAEWTGETSPAIVLAGWESLARTGSVVIDPEMRASIADELRDWARGEIGDLDRPETFHERYAIDVVRLPSTHVNSQLVQERLCTTRF